MLYTQGAVSSKPWKPIFDVRGRPAWVQTTVFDFLKQLKVRRTAKATLPTIDTVTLPSHRQVWVPFGKLEALCDGVEFILNSYGALGVSYGGPDDRGTVWIRFYRMRAADLECGNPLQFVIWISSVRQPAIALEDGVKTVYEQIASPTSSLETAVLKFQWQVPHYRMYGAQIADFGRWEEEQTARENNWLKRRSKGPKWSIELSLGNDGREFPDSAMGGVGGGGGG